MLWFYTRERETLKAETRFDNQTGEYVLILHWPDGREETERFPDPTSFQRRLEALNQRLEAEHWRPDGPPQLLPNGWPRSRGEGGGGSVR